MLVPSLRWLRLTASVRRTRAPVPQRGPSAQHTEQARVQDGYAFGAALSALLKRSTRLQELKLSTLDVGRECVSCIAQCMGAMQALSSVKLSAAEMDNEGTTALMQHACKHTALAELSLNCCWVHDECLGPGEPSSGKGALGPFSQWLLSLPELRKLEFVECEMGVMGEHLLSRNLAGLQKVGEVGQIQCTKNSHLSQQVPESKGAASKEAAASREAGGREAGGREAAGREAAGSPDS